MTPVVPEADLVDPKVVHELLCGEGSVLHLFSKTLGVRHLVNDVSVSVIPRSRVTAYAMFDPDDVTGQTPMICLTTAVYEQAKEYLVQALDHADGAPIWEDLCWKPNSCTSEEFCDTCLRILLDFLSLHEISHVARGHLHKAVQLGVDRVCGTDTSQTTAAFDYHSKLRMALELDADNLAIYSMITLKQHIKDHVPYYSRVKSDAAFVATLSFSVHILFAMLCANRAPSPHDSNLAKPLKELHIGATHPDPSIRGEFFFQRVLQLADPEEAPSFKQGLNRSLEVFSRLVKSGLFPDTAVRSWFLSSREVVDFTNDLIDAIAEATEGGWIQGPGSRFHLSITEE